MTVSSVFAESRLKAGFESSFGSTGSGRYRFAAFRHLYLSSDLPPVEKLSALLGACVSTPGFPGLHFLLDLAGYESVDELACYEVILQSYLFLGYPTAIEALRSYRAWSGGSGDSPPPDERAPGQHLADGLELCRRVYGENFEKLQVNMRALSPELARWMLAEGYGKVLSRPRLGPVPRELSVIATLCVTSMPRQLRAHIRGAMNVGASPDAIRWTIEAAGFWAGERALNLGFSALDGVTSESE